MHASAQLIAVPAYIERHWLMSIEETSEAAWSSPFSSSSRDDAERFRFGIGAVSDSALLRDFLSTTSDCLPLPDCRADERFLLVLGEVLDLIVHQPFKNFGPHRLNTYIFRYLFLRSVLFIIARTVQICSGLLHGIGYGACWLGVCGLTFIASLNLVRRSVDFSDRGAMLLSRHPYGDK